MTVSAAHRLMPRPPARVDRRKRKTEGSVLNATIRACRSFNNQTPHPDPSNQKGDTVAGPWKGRAGDAPSFFENVERKRTHAHEGIMPNTQCICRWLWVDSTRPSPPPNFMHRTHSRDDGGGGVRGLTLPHRSIDAAERVPCGGTGRTRRAGKKCGGRGVGGGKTSIGGPRPRKPTAGCDMPAYLLSKKNNDKTVIMNKK